MKTALVLFLLVVTLTWCEGHGKPSLEYSDDEIVANNYDEQGLEIRRSAICYQPAKRGPCKSTIIRFFFDPGYNMCNYFVYGGCGGNTNNFRTLRECMQACILP